MPKNYCIMQIRAEPEKTALPICNYSQILYQFLTFTQNLKRSLVIQVVSIVPLLLLEYTIILFAAIPNLTSILAFSIIPQEI